MLCCTSIHFLLSPLLEFYIPCILLSARLGISRKGCSDNIADFTEALGVFQCFPIQCECPPNAWQILFCPYLLVKRSLLSGEGWVSGFASDGMRLQLPAVLARLLSDIKMVMDFLELPLPGMPGMLSIAEAPFTFWGTKGFSFLHCCLGSSAFCSNEIDPCVCVRVFLRPSGFFFFLLVVIRVLLLVSCFC